jgi:hypothetical protein
MKSKVASPLLVAQIMSNLEAVLKKFIGEPVDLQVITEVLQAVTSEFNDMPEAPHQQGGRPPSSTA